MRVSPRSRIILLTLLLGPAVALAAADGDSLERNPYPFPSPTPKEVLIRHATLWTMESAGILKERDILLRDGKIAAIGQDLKAAPDALVIDALGKHVTPGLIDAHSHSAVEGFGVNEGARSVTAEVRIQDVLDPTDRYIYLQLAGGLTVANVLHGSANAIGGQNAVIKLRWGVENPHDLLFTSAPPGIKFALGENPKRSNFPALPGLPQRYPKTRMGVRATIEHAFEQARLYRAKWQHYRALSAEEQARTVPPRRDLQMEALVEVLEGKRLVHSHSYRADEILMLIRLADRFGFHVRTFQHVLEGYRVADEMARHGAGGSTFSDWWAYKMEAYDAIPYNAAIMTRRGVVVSLNSDSGNLARRLNLEAAKTVRYGGLRPEEALALVTINPARQLGIDDHAGSLKEGKDADLVIWSGNPLSVYSQVEDTFVDGQLMFSRERDLEYRKQNEQVRRELIERIREEGKKKKKKEKTEKKEEKSKEPSPPAKTSEKKTEEEAPKLDPAPPAVEYHFSPFANRRPIAIVGATVHTLEGDPIPNGVVVFEKGRITAVGDRHTRIPRGARRVLARGKHLWPGIIHVSTVLGLTEIDSVAGSVDVSEMGEWNSDIDAYVSIRPASEHIPVARSAGITQAISAPRTSAGFSFTGQGSSPVIAGTSTFLRTEGWTWEEMEGVRREAMMLAWPDTALSPFAAFFGNPSSLADRKKKARERRKKIDQFFSDARAYAKARRAAQKEGRTLEIDPKLEAMQPVLDGKLPLFVTANSRWSIQDAVKWALKEGFRIVIVGGRDSAQVADFLAQHQVPVILDDVAGDPAGKDEPYDVAYTTPARLARAGVLFAIASSGGPGSSANARHITVDAGMAAAFGLERQEAYRAITLNPARILGLDSVLGSIAVGKSASLALTNGDLLEQTTVVEQVWIDGHAPSMMDKHKRLYQKYLNRPKTR